MNIYIYIYPISHSYPIFGESHLKKKNIIKAHDSHEIPMIIPSQLPLLVGGFNHLEKYESQWEGLSHILWKIKTVRNHQPDQDNSH